MVSGDCSDGFVKVFVSSTYIDMKKERRELIERLNRSVCAIGMEGFIPSEKSSQETALLDDYRGLKNCDAAIFLITPWYGSLLKNCTIPDCKASCSMKPKSIRRKRRRKVSYTHCEYNYARGKRIPYQAYLIENRWDFQNYSEQELKHLIRVKKRARAWRREIKRDAFTKRIDDTNITAMADRIAKDLATNLILWHNKGKIEFREFCGRKSELKKLADELQNGVTVGVWGVGGIGKTTLIQAALLIEILRGRCVVTVGRQQTYMSGSGYRYFRENKHHSHHSIIGDTITLDDIGLGLGIDLITEIADPKKKIKAISDLLKNEKEKKVLFIDDYHLADKGVKELLKDRFLPIILSSKCCPDNVYTTIHILGLAEDERGSLIDEIAGRHSMEITEYARERIREIAEGHPVTTEILVRNSNKIDFDELSSIKRDCLDRTTEVQIDEFCTRIVEKILSDEAYRLLKNLAVLNTSVEGNISKRTAGRAYNNNRTVAHFNELIDAGILKKKEEGQYHFTFRHLKEMFQTDEQSFHRDALTYYSQKAKERETTLEDQVEILYHRLCADECAGETKDITKDYGELARAIPPSAEAYRRLLEIGELPQAEQYRDTSTDFNFTRGTLLRGYNRYREAGHAYKGALKIHCSESSEQNDIMIKNIYNELGSVHRIMRLAGEAKDYYLKACNDTADPDFAQTEEYQSLQADIMNNFAILHRTQGQYIDAERKYQKALEINIALSKNDPGKYQASIAQVHNNLGVLYRHLKRDKEAEEALLEALKIRRHLVSSDPGKYRLGKYRLPLATTLNILGRLYIHWEKYTDAKPLLDEAYEIKKKLADKSPEAYIPTLTITITSLGLYYYRIQEYEEAERELKRALDLRRELAHKSPQAYNFRLANTLNILGMVYRDTGRYKEAEEALKEAYRIRRRLADINPDSFERHLADTLNNLGILYTQWDNRDTGRYEEAEEALKEACRIRKRLADINPDSFERHLADTLNNLGILYTQWDNRDTGRYEEAEEALKEAYKIRSHLANSNPDSFERSLANTLNNLGTLYTQWDKYDLAESHLKGALEIQQNLVKKSAEAHVPSLRKILENLISLSRRQGRKDKEDRYSQLLARYAPSAHR